MSKSSLVKMFIARVSAKDHPEAIRNVRHYYELRQDRLDKFGLSVTSLFTAGGLFDGSELAKWEDDHYTESCIVNSGTLETGVKKDGKVLYKSKDKKLFYTSVTDTKGESLISTDPYCCPNCGAVSTAQQLLSGCSYCGTRFEMKDLFPKVSLNYTVTDMYMEKGEAKHEILRYVIPPALIAIAVNAVFQIMRNDGLTFDSVISAVLIAGAGAFLGYLFWALKKIGKVFGEGAKSAAMLPALGSGRKFTKFMSKYSPEFSFEHFRGDVISMLNILIFSEKDTELPFYTGKDNDLFEDVVDSSFRGALKLERFSVKNNVCAVGVTAFLEDLHYSGGRIRKKNDKVYMTLEKDLSSDENYPFGIHAVKCRSCSGSFDAYRSRTCPYCGRPYEAKDLGWTVKEFRKV